MAFSKDFDISGMVVLDTEIEKKTEKIMNLRNSHLKFSLDYAFS